MRKGSTMDEEVLVPLRPGELLERGKILAAKVQDVAILRKKKTDDARATQALIDAGLDEMERLARVISAGEEDRPQRELFVDQVVDQPTATAVLAEMEKRAQAGNGPAAPVRDGLNDGPPLP